MFITRTSAGGLQQCIKCTHMSRLAVRCARFIPRHLTLRSSNFCPKAESRCPLLPCLTLSLFVQRISIMRTPESDHWAEKSHSKNHEYSYLHMAVISGSAPASYLCEGANWRCLIWQEAAVVVKSNNLHESLHESNRELKYGPTVTYGFEILLSENKKKRNPLMNIKWGWGSGRWARGPKGESQEQVGGFFR